MAAAPLAPAAVSLSMFALGIGAACVFVLLLGLRWAWQYTFGALLEALAAVRINLPGRHDLHPLSWLRRYNVAVQNDIERKLEKSHRAMGYLFHGAAIIMEWTAREIAGLAADTLHFGQSLSHVRMPRLTRAMIIAAFPLPWLARRVAALVRAHAIPSTRTVIARTTRPIIQRVTRIVKATAGAVVIPGVLWGTLPRLRGLERWRNRTGSRLRKLERGIAGVSAVALVGTALARLGLNWIRCRRVGRVGKAVCGMDSNLLGAVLADATLIIGTISIVELTRGTQRLMPAITDATGYLVREAPQAWNETPRDVLRDALSVFPDFPG
jgi:hypothetical protein